MTDYRYNTDIDITIDGVTVEYAAIVFFSHYAGCAGDLTDPQEDAQVELYDIHVTIPGRDPFKLGPPALLDALNDALREEMFAFVVALTEEEADARRQARRDD